MKTIVVYKTKYGSSGQYALWIAESLQCKAEDIERVRAEELLSYDVVVYVGGLYAGAVNGFKRFRKHLEVLQSKKLVLCMVGMTDPAERERYQQVFMSNVPEQYRDIVTAFALRGDQLFSKMSGLHRIMMKMPKSMIEKIPVEQRTEENKRFLEHFGEDARFVKQENIHDVVEYISGLQGTY